MKKVLLSALIMLLCSGCLSLKFPTFSSRPTTKVQQNYHVIQYSDRKQGIKYKEVIKSKEKSVPQKTIMEKVGSWVSGLSFWLFILIGLGMFLAPTVTISILFSLWKRARRAFIETVQAIKQSNAVRENEKLHNALASSQTPDTKRMVSEIKSKL